MHGHFGDVVLESWMGFHMFIIHVAIAIATVIANPGVPRSLLFRNGAQKCRIPGSNNVPF
jgi:hypothetical protein